MLRLRISHFTFHISHFTFQISDFRFQKIHSKASHPQKPIREIDVILGENRFILLAIFSELSRFSR